jgi:hypothetical protein
MLLSSLIVAEGWLKAPLLRRCLLASSRGFNSRGSVLAATGATGATGGHPQQGVVSDRNILLVGANNVVNKIVEQHVQDNGFPNAKGVIVPSQLEQIEMDVRSKSYFLIILGGAVPKYPEVGTRIRAAVEKYSPSTIVHQVQSPPPSPPSPAGQELPPPPPLEVTGARIAAANLKIIQTYIAEIR